MFCPTDIMKEVEDSIQKEEDIYKDLLEYPKVVMVTKRELKNLRSACEQIINTANSTHGKSLEDQVLAFRIATKACELAVGCEKVKELRDERTS